jgi:hypothetical protein
MQIKKDLLHVTHCIIVIIWPKKNYLFQHDMSFTYEHVFVVN